MLESVLEFPLVFEWQCWLVAYIRQGGHHIGQWPTFLVMFALWNRADHYIFILWFLLSSFFFCFSSPNLSRAILPHMVWGLSANVRCRSEMCCTQLAENTGCKKVAKNRHLGTIAQLCRAISSQLSPVSTIGKKNLLSNNMSSRCPHNMVNFCPLGAEIGSGVWCTGTPANFNGFRILAALLHGTPAVGVSQSLRHWTEGATYIRQGDHDVGHWPTFYLCLFCVLHFFWSVSVCAVVV